MTSKFAMSWARLTAIALLALSLPSFVLPAAVVGLILLADGKGWADYVGQKLAMKG